MGVGGEIAATGKIAVVVGPLSCIRNHLRTSSPFELKGMGKPRLEAQHPPL